MFYERWRLKLIDKINLEEIDNIGSKRTRKNFKFNMFIKVREDIMFMKWDKDFIFKKEIENKKVI